MYADHVQSYQSCAKSRGFDCGCDFGCFRPRKTDCPLLALLHEVQLLNNVVESVGSGCHHREVSDTSVLLMNDCGYANIGAEDAAGAVRIGIFGFPLVFRYCRVDGRVSEGNVMAMTGI